MTLDEAKDAFQATPNRRTARDYVATAKRYWSDEMVGTETLDAAVREVQARGYAAAARSGLAG